MNLVAATRGSRLALIQVEIVAAELGKLNSPVAVETRIVKTTGDLVRDRPIDELDQKGVFTKAVDNLVLGGEADFSIHSMKDLPTELLPGLAIIAVPKRASSYEVFVSVEYGSLDDLPAGAVVGTSSPRRTAQLLHIRGDLEVKLIRGNVDTRLRKLEEGQYDALILAEAGLVRLNREDVIKKRLSTRDFTPPAGQGALAVVAREDDAAVAEILCAITHQPSFATVEAERAFIETLGGGCKTPIGVVARLGCEMKLYASIMSPDGRLRFQYKKSGETTDPRAFGKNAALEALELGASRIVERWR
jgi:hydroxymethylbilane synthase